MALHTSFGLKGNHALTLFVRWGCLQSPPSAEQASSSLNAMQGTFPLIASWWFRIGCNCWGEGIADLALAVFSAGAIAAVCTPFTGADVDLEIVGSADGAEIGVIPPRVIGTTIRFELVEVIENAKFRHQSSPCSSLAMSN